MYWRYGTGLLEALVPVEGVTKIKVELGEAGIVGLLANTNVMVLREVRGMERKVTFRFHLISILFTFKRSNCMKFRVFCYKFGDFNRKDLVLNNTVRNRTSSDSKLVPHQKWT